jgi:type I restriction enzyme S subunit
MADMNGKEHRLPHSWRWVRLGEVCDFVYGSALPSGVRQSGTIPVFGSNGIVGYHNRPLTGGPTIVIGRKGSIGAIHFSPVACWPIDTTYYIERPRLDADLVWLSYWLRALNLHALNKAAAVPGLNRDDAFALEIPLPPPSEQKRIAATLDEQMATVERARAAAEAQLDAARALPAAYLRAVFNSLEAQEWPKKRLGDVGDIVSGVTLGRKVGDVKTRKVPYLRVANVKDGYLDLADVYEIEATETEITRWRLKSGDLLLTEGGDPDKLGRGTFWEGQIPECIHQNHIFRVRFRLDELLPPFVSAQIGSQYGKAYFLAHAKQTTGIATINQKVLAGFPLMVPPLAEQQHVAAILSDHMEGVERLHKSLEAQFDAINKLPEALLRRAFRGELG